MYKYSISCSFGDSIPKTLVKIAVRKIETAVKDMFPPNTMGNVTISEHQGSDCVVTYSVKPGFPGITKTQLPAAIDLLLRRTIPTASSFVTQPAAASG